MRPGESPGLKPSGRTSVVVRGSYSLEVDCDPLERQQSAGRYRDRMLGRSFVTKFRSAAELFCRPPDAFNGQRNNPYASEERCRGERFDFSQLAIAPPSSPSEFP